MSRLRVPASVFVPRRPPGRRRARRAPLPRPRLCPVPARIFAVPRAPPGPRLAPLRRALESIAGAGQLIVGTPLGQRPRARRRAAHERAAPPGSALHSRRLSLQSAHRITAPTIRAAGAPIAWLATMRASAWLLGSPSRKRPRAASARTTCLRHVLRVRASLSDRSRQAIGRLLVSAPTSCSNASRSPRSARADEGGASPAVTGAGSSEEDGSHWHGARATDGSTTAGVSRSSAGIGGSESGRTALPPSQPASTDSTRPDDSLPRSGQGHTRYVRPTPPAHPTLAGPVSRRRPRKRHRPARDYTLAQCKVLAPSSGRSHQRRSRHPPPAHAAAPLTST